jgi:hypothetical protein
MGHKDKINAFNLFKVITDSDSPTNLFSVLSDKLTVLQNQHIEAKMENIDEVDETGVYQNYLYFFKSNKFIVS